MAKKKLVVTFYFDEVEDEMDPDYSYLDYKKMKIDGNLTKEERDSVAEGWAQSDRYWVDICGELVNNI